MIVLQRQGDELVTLKHRDGEYALLYCDFCAYHGTCLHPGSSCKANKMQADRRRKTREATRRRINEATKRREASYARAVADASKRP